MAVTFSLGQWALVSGIDRPGSDLSDSEFLPILAKAIIATAAFAGLRRGELRGLEWTDYSGDALNVKRSVWKTVVNQPKTRASAKPVPVIRQLAEILDTYRSSIGNPQSGVMFHTGAGRALGYR